MNGFGTPPTIFCTARGFLGKVRGGPPLTSLDGSSSCSTGTATMVSGLLVRLRTRPLVGTHGSDHNANLPLRK